MIPSNFDHTARPHTRRLPLEMFPCNKQSPHSSPFVNIICFKIIKNIQRFVFCLVTDIVCSFDFESCGLGGGGRMDQNVLPLTITFLRPNMFLTSVLGL